MNCSLRGLIGLASIVAVSSGVSARQVLLEPKPAGQAPAPKSEPIPLKTISGFEVILKVPEAEGILQASRTLVIFSKTTEKVKEPRFALQDWNDPPQVLGADWHPTDGKMIVENSWAGFPKKLSELDPGDYWVQAIVRRNLDGCFPGGNGGDAYSEPIRIILDPKAQGVATLEVNKVHIEPPMATSTRVKFFEMKSDALSTHYGRTVNQRAGIFLPKNFATETDKTYPVVVFIGGFNSTHYSLGQMARVFPADFLANIIFIVPDPSTMYGHSVFADSENNGPRGKALVEEMLPAIEKEYRGKGPLHRYVSGISSGGWGSLWLQITYPDQFAGCWSFCPDPVDFRDFQQIDLYAKDVNMYTNAAGARRPLSRRGDIIELWYDDFVRMETAIGPSGQIGSFEAVFSPKGKDGRPQPLFDRETGVVDSAVAASWQKYDIRLQLEKNWGELSKKLPGKLHIYAGGKDTFYLEGAAKLLKTSLKSLASDAVVEVVPGMVHTFYKPGVVGMVRDISKREGLSSELLAPKPADPTPANGPDTK